MNKLTASEFYKMLTYAAACLEEQAEKVNTLNVFPVPDGDTGSNMSMTLAGVRNISADKLGTLASCAQSAADNMLRSARGNSGVILSVFFKGLAKGLEGKTSADCVRIARAMTNATEAAYGAVMNPTEGTILTVMRGASEALVGAYPDSVEELLEIATSAAQTALDHTPDQLPLLKEAGVVDAGGCGFMIILNAFLACVKGEAADFKVPEPATAIKMNAAAECDSEIVFPYCTECIIEKDAGSKKGSDLRNLAVNIGDSVVFVEDDEIIKIHVHTGDPGAILTQAVKHGALISVKIENMRKQHTELSGEFSKVELADGVGFVAVASGDGISDIFKDLGVDVVVSGGQTMNPSTDDLLDAIKATSKKNVFILPNNSNIVLTAGTAASLAKEIGIEAAVIPSKTIPQGITAMFSYDESSSFEDNKELMNDSLSTVRSASVTHAVRDAVIDGLDIKEGQFIGLVEGKVRYTADTLYDCVDKLAEGLEGKSCITAYCGDEMDDKGVGEIERELEMLFGDNTDVTVIRGGQPVYTLILSAE